MSIRIFENPYLMNALKPSVEDVSFVDADEDLVQNSKILMLALQKRLDLYLSGRVDVWRHHHWIVYFIRDNLAPMSDAMCLVGHSADRLESYSISECILVLPKE